MIDIEEIEREENVKKEEKAKVKKKENVEVVKAATDKNILVKAFIPPTSTIVSTSVSTDLSNFDSVSQQSREFFTKAEELLQQYMMKK